MAAQARYARVLDVGMRMGLVLLAAGLAAYFAHVLPARIDPADLPSAWAGSAAEYLERIGAAAGYWDGAALEGGVLPMIGIAALCTVPLACLATLIPFYAQRRDWIYLGVVTAQVVLLALAASGLLTAGH